MWIRGTRESRGSSARWATWSFLGIARPTDAGKAEDINFLQFKRGDLGDRNAGRLAKELREEIETLVGFGIKKHFLFEGLSEAITNVGQHAYPAGEGYQIRQWWVSASSDTRARELRVMFYDQGAGIPGTLRRWKLFELVKEAFSSWTDSQKIEAAMEVGRSSSGLSERGKGLQNLVEFARTQSGRAPFDLQLAGNV